MGADSKSRPFSRVSPYKRVLIYRKVIVCALGQIIICYYLLFYIW